MPIVVTYALVIAEPCAWAGARQVARCDSFEIRTAWSVCTVVYTVLCKDAHKLHAAVDSGCDENVHQMCELPNPGRVPVATEVMALWRPSGDERALMTRAPLAMERRTIHSGLSIGREESLRIVSGRTLTTNVLGSLDAHLCGLAVTCQFGVPCRHRMLADLWGGIPHVRFRNNNLR